MRAIENVPAQVRLMPVRGAVLLAVALTGVTLALPRVADAVRPIPLRATSADEFNAFAGNGFVGWAQNSRRHPNSYHLFLRDAAGNERRVNRPVTESFGGGIDGTTVVYEELTRTENRVVLYDTAARAYTELPLASGARAYMHPTISGEWVLYTTGVRGQRTSVRLYNRSTGEIRQLASIRGRRRFVYSGQVSGDWAAWGRVLPRSQDVFLTRVTTGKTVRVARSPGVDFQYNPAVALTGTLFFVRNKPCLRRCQKLNTPAAVNQLVALRRGGRPRVLVTLPKGQDGGYMYAAPRGNRSRVLYSRFRWLRPGAVSYSDIFAFTVSG